MAHTGKLELGTQPSPTPIDRNTTRILPVPVSILHPRIIDFAIIRLAACEILVPCLLLADNRDRETVSIEARELIETGTHRYIEYALSKLLHT